MEIIWKKVAGKNAYTTLHAGMELKVSEVNKGRFSGCWQVTYQGQQHDEHFSLAEAKSYAPKFAIECIQRAMNQVAGRQGMVVSSDPICDLDNLMDTCGAFPDVLARMKILLGMVREETETLREGILSLDPEAQLAREGELLDRVEALKAAASSQLQKSAPAFPAPSRKTGAGEYLDKMGHEALLVEAKRLARHVMEWEECSLFWMGERDALQSPVKLA
jgi:hypothetical protein